MKRKILAFFLIFIMAVLGECQHIKEEKKPKEKVVLNLENLSHREISSSSTWEELVIEGSEILNQSFLNILTVDNGNFYGLGYGPSGDGSKVDSIYKFNFEGKLDEKLDKSRIINILPNLMDKKTNKYYYLDYDINSGSSKLLEVDLKTLTRKEISLIDDLENAYIEPLHIGDDHIYYKLTNYDDSNMFYKYTISSGKTRDISPKDLEDIDYSLFLISYGQNDKIQYLGGYQGEKENIFEYDLVENRIRKIYDRNFLNIIGTNETYVCFEDYENEEVLIWNKADGYFSHKLVLGEGQVTRRLSKTNTIIIEDMRESMVYLVDFIDQEISLLDLGEFNKLVDEGEVDWYFDGIYIYGHWIDVYDFEDIERDRFFRKKL